MVKTCLLTVGSTRFDQLVSAFLSPDSLESLSDLGVNHVVAQVGNSLLPPGYHLGTTALPGGVRLEVFRFAGDLEEQVGNADLVVSHAGPYKDRLHCFARALNRCGLVLITFFCTHRRRLTAIVHPAPLDVRRIVTGTRSPPQARPCAEFDSDGLASVRPRGRDGQERLGDHLLDSGVCPPTLPSLPSLLSPVTVDLITLSHAETCHLHYAASERVATSRQGPPSRRFPSWTRARCSGSSTRSSVTLESFFCYPGECTLMILVQES